MNNGKDNLKKFDAKSDEAIFLGYSINSKPYRIFNKRTLTMEESIHVIFDEDILSPLKKEECIDNDIAIIKKKIKDMSLQEKPTLEGEEIVNKDQTYLPKE